MVTSLHFDSYILQLLFLSLKLFYLSLYNLYSGASSYRLNVTIFKKKNLRRFLQYFQEKSTKKASRNNVQRDLKNAVSCLTFTKLLHIRTHASIGIHVKNILLPRITLFKQIYELELIEPSQCDISCKRKDAIRKIQVFPIRENGNKD